MFVCFVCRKPSVIQCERCGMVSYFSHHHQKLHYNAGHKFSCQNGMIQISGSEHSITDSNMFYQCWGCCLDCVDNNPPVVQEQSYVCDGCNSPNICNTHESVYKLCKVCRQKWWSEEYRHDSMWCTIKSILYETN